MTTLTPDTAQSAWAHLLPQIESSRQMTRLLIQGFPAEHLDARPVPHGGTFADMLWYLSSVYHVFLDGVCEGQFEELPAMPEARSTASFLAWDDEHFGATLDKLRRLGGDELLKPVTFAGQTQSALDFLSAFLGNVHHHVGQLLAYLSVVLPEPAVSPPATASEDGELTDEQLAAVAGGVQVTFVQHSQTAQQLGWIAPPQTFATLGALLGDGGGGVGAAGLLGGLGLGVGGAAWAQWIMFGTLAFLRL